MQISSAIEQLFPDMCQWRHHIHQYPELAYQELKTSEYIRDVLQSFGLEVHCGLGQTGIVATLKNGGSPSKIGLRADIDALAIHEKNDLSYRSKHDGVMHACGHDGHTAMLLGTAKYLAAKKNFNGTVYFIFQPAEEGQGGAKQMIEDGLFDLFPADSVFAMHNFHDLPIGHFAIKPGPMMASSDMFEIKITGRGSHAAMPHLGRDPIVALSQIILSLQTIVSRSIDPADSVVVSVTSVHAGSTWNAIPNDAVLRGTFRCFDPNVRALIKQRIEQAVNAHGQVCDVQTGVEFNPGNPGYPVTINDAEATATAMQVAIDLVGSDKVNTAPAPSMGAEDFSFMLQEKPGCYLWIGNGSAENGCMLHNPNYNFNDNILTTGAAYWVRLVEAVLA
ncbi:MAG: M20 aminoacylase family protein [Methylococcaceae bacterium]